jgi:hypothetical protein
VGVATLRGIREAKQKLARFAREVDSVTNEEIDYFSRQVEAKAKALAPFETGRLEKSIVVRRHLGRDRKEVVVRAKAMHKGYDYAPIQHENTAYNHPIKGQAKFIEEPFNQEYRNMVRRIKRRLGQ